MRLCITLLVGVQMYRICTSFQHSHRTLQVYAVVDRDGTRQNVSSSRILSGLNSPNGVAYQDGSLWVAEITNVTRYDNVDTAVLSGQVSRSPPASLNRSHMTTLSFLLFSAPRCSDLW